MKKSMNTHNCYVLFSVEYPTFHCMNPIWYKKETQQIQISSKQHLKNLMNTIFSMFVDKSTINRLQNLLLFNLNLVYELVYSFFTFNLMYDSVYI